MGELLVWASYLDRKVAVEVGSGCTVDDLVKAVEAVMGLRGVRLHFGGVELRREDLLADTGLSSEAAVEVSIKGHTLGIEGKTDNIEGKVEGGVLRAVAKQSFYPCYLSCLLTNIPFTDTPWESPIITIENAGINDEVVMGFAAAPVPRMISSFNKHESPHPLLVELHTAGVQVRVPGMGPVDCTKRGSTWSLRPDTTFQLVLTEGGITVKHNHIFGEPHPVPAEMVKQFWRTVEKLRSTDQLQNIRFFVGFLTHNAGSKIRVTWWNRWGT